MHQTVTSDLKQQELKEFLDIDNSCNDTLEVS